MGESTVVARLPRLTAEAVKQAVGEVTAWRASLRERAAHREHVVDSGGTSRWPGEPGLNLEWRVQAAHDLARQQRLDEEQSLVDLLHERARELRRVLDEELGGAKAPEPQQPDPVEWGRLQVERDRVAAAGGDTSRLDARLQAAGSQQRQHERWSSQRARALERAAAAHHEFELIHRELEDIHGPPPADIPDGTEVDLTEPREDEPHWSECLDQERRYDRPSREPG